MRSLRRLPLQHTTAAEAMRDAYERFDERMQERVAAAERWEGAASPCRKGCAHCCRQPVLGNVAELPVLVEAVRALPSTVREQVRQRIARWFHEVARLGADPLFGPERSRAYLRAGIVCPLVDPRDQSCLVYAARPIGCRAHQVVGSDPALCKDPAAQLTFVQALDLVNQAAADFAADYSGSARPVATVIGYLPVLLRSAWSLVDAREPDFQAWCDASASLSVRAQRTAPVD
jgi:Fe-S-cluster containining protein